MNRQALLAEILTLLQKLESLVKLNNGVGLTDINGLSEDFFLHLLNQIFDLDLVNLNLEKKNFPGVDLGDKTKRVCVQITSDSSRKKVQDAVNKFVKHALDRDYDTLKVVLITAKKKKFSKPINNNECSAYEPGNLMDLADLVAHIKSFPIEKIEKICEFLRAELEDKKRSDGSSIANEVKTIADLIVYLSKNKSLIKTEWVEEPDPKGKIESRFAAHSQLLKDEIVDLIPKYAAARMEVDNSLGLDVAMSEFIRSYLRSKSNDFLADCGDDPRKALHALTEYFANELSRAGGNYDHQAIRYYLLDELINCNVFPVHAL